MPYAARPAARWIATAALCAVGVAAALSASAAPPGTAGPAPVRGGAVAAPPVPSITSDNVKHIAGIPETTAISMEFARTDPFAYVSSLDTLSVLDLTDPRNPVLRGSLTQALFENEAMTYGERRENGRLTRFVIAGIDLFRVATDDPEHVNVDDGAQMAIIDVTDPDHPRTRSVTPLGDMPGAITSSTHTVQCVDQANCRYAYTAGGREGFFSVLDLGDLDKPREVATVFSPAAGPNPVFRSGAGHYWDFDGRVGWHTGSGGAAAFDVSNPLRPVLLNASNRKGIEPGLNDFIAHNSMRPNAAAFRPGAPPSIKNGNVLLVTEEDYANDGDEVVCSRAGSFQTWYVPDLNGAAYRARNPDGRKVGLGTIAPLDSTNAPVEFEAGATPPATAFCSAHWFDVHQDGYVAQGWYGAGMRLLDVRDARHITQFGYATGLATEVWDAYWVPKRDARGVAIPGQKTNIVYTADAVRGIEVFEVALPSAARRAAPAAASASPAAPSGPPAGSGSGSGSGPGSGPALAGDTLPATGVDPLLPAVGLALLAATAAVLRRRHTA
ncbi:MAG: hypothetical protein JWN57_181 [Frankiales bacterium]|nr:hypothetical protein [Frankiales bacterium]